MKTDIHMGILYYAQQSLYLYKSFKRINKNMYGNGFGLMK